MADDLAKSLGITVWSLNDIVGLEDIDIRQLTVIDPDSWSALTIRLGVNDLVLFNPAQSNPRINSVVMHELSHIILGHELAPADLTEEGHLVPRFYEQDQEDEADWLGGTLLLPRPALLRIRKEELTDDAARTKFQVSQDMLTWRFRMTGVDYQIANSRAKRRTAS